MKIEYFGHSCFLMRSEGGVRFLTDPYTGVGYDMPRAEAEYVTCSHGHFDHTFVEGVGGVREVISSPGAWRGWSESRRLPACAPPQTSSLRRAAPPARSPPAFRRRAPVSARRGNL